MNYFKNTSWLYPFLLIFLWLTFGIAHHSKAQIEPNVEIVYNDNPPKFKPKAPTDASLDSVQELLKKQYFENGYLDFSIDSIQSGTDTIILYIHNGDKYKLHQIIVTPEEYEAYSKKYILNKKLSPSLIELHNVKLLKWVQNQGYPYAILEKDVKLMGNQATLLYKIKEGNLVLFDSISTSPPNLISYNYISKKTGIEFGKPYNFSVIKNLKRNVNQSQLFTLDTNYTMLSESQAKIILKLKKINQNSFSALVGLQTNSENKTEVTGNVSIALCNAFKKGEKINLDWQKPANESQQLETDLIFPYIFRLPIGAQFYANLDKQDSSFTNTNIRLAGLLPTVNLGEYSINVKWQTSSVNTNSSIELNSTYSTLYGIGYQYSLLDNPRIPKHGFSFKSQIYSGNNNLIIQGHDDTKTLMVEWIGNIQLAFQLPIGSFFIKNEWGILKNDSLKLNNLYRLGGANSIRGFNEKSIYSQAYNFTNFEYRLYLNTESFMYLLYDLGYFNEPDSKSFTGITRQAVGAGLNINTSAGHLSISYAIGKYSTEPFSMNKGKIHIGYINWF